MNDSVLRAILKRHKKEKRWIALVLCLSMLVSLGTFTSLRMRGEARTYTRRVLDCPYALDDAEPVAHIHNEDCCDEAGNLVCTLPEILPHEHTEACFARERGELICGLEEYAGHVHNENCYESYAVNLCGLEESEGHVHSDECLTRVQDELICENTDPEHEHSDECWTWHDELICGLEEGQGAHIHDDTCFVVEQKLVCSLEEGEGAHWHDDSCYEWHDVLSCGEVELPVHMHDADCFRVEEIELEDEPEPDAEPEEGEEPAVSAAVEGNGEPDKTEPEDAVDGDQEIGEAEEAGTAETVEEKVDAPADVIPEDLTEELAEAPIEEKPEEEEAPEQSAEDSEQTEEAEDSTDAAEEAVEPADEMPAQSFDLTEDGIRVIVEAAEGAFPADTRMEVTPVNLDGMKNDIEEALESEVLEVQAVDIKFYDTGDNEIEPLMPIRVTIVPVESEHADQTAQVVHIDKENVPEVIEQAEDARTESEREVVFDAESFSIYAVVYSAETTFKSATGETYRITLDYDKNAGIPKGATLAVSEILEENEKYGEFLTQAEEAVGENKQISYARFFDISILSDGEEIQPLTPVSVKVELTQLPEETGEADAQVLHFSDPDATPEVLKTEASGENISFETEGFSVYGVVYTVDFHYEANGKTYAFSIPGGGFISLEHLLEAIGFGKNAADENGEDDVAVIEETVTPAAPETAININAIPVSEETKRFVEDVERVVFTSPELVWVGRTDNDCTVGTLKESNLLEIQYSSDLTEEQRANINAQPVAAGDWVLIGLCPFCTEEGLTVTMKNGDEFTIRVTDAQISRTVIDARGDAWEITVTYDASAQIPDGAELKVTEILPEDEEYQEYYQKASEKAGIFSDFSAAENAETKTDRYIHVFNIEIWSDEQKVEPASNVSVSMKLQDAPADENTDLQIVHFGRDGLELMELAGKGNESKAGDTELNFVTDEFSVYTVVDAGSTNLAGRSFALVSGIANDPGATTGYSETWGRDYFTIIVNAHAVSNTVRGNGIDTVGVHTWTENGTSYAGGEAPEWTFESAGNGKYYLSVIDKNGNKKYMTRKGPYDWDASIGDLTDSNRQYSQFTITSNGDGTALIYYDGGSNDQKYYLYNDGNGEWGGRTYKFRNTEYDTSSPAYRFKLCQKSDDFDSFAARKVSASSITTNANYVIYRKFEDSSGNEALYALAHDGTFVRVYDGGDTIYWRETDKNIYWNYQIDGSYPVLFTQNPTTHETIYINPNHSTGQTLSTTAGDLTLIGKGNGEYSTAIECWDQKAYDYAGLHVTRNNDGTASLSTGTRVAGSSDEFLFAVASTYPGATAETVDTVDSDSLGIKITMFDYGDWNGNYNAGDKLPEMTGIAGSADYTPHAAHALVKPYLENNVPSGANGAMTGLFSSGGAIRSSKSDVNHLFLQSYYDENGTFRYRSEDNYAYLPFSNGQITGTDFIVYRQAATPYTSDNSPGHTYYYHGHFMPFNDIDMNNNLSRLMNQYGNEYTNGKIVGEIPLEDGRTYEEIYGVQGTPNFYTGMKMEANFAQPRNGKLENGDDMIFKFTGDDDMWVYIDGVLVLDIGGIHEPLSGTINFATGKVTNPAGSSLAGTTTLYQIFQNVLTASDTPQSVKEKISSITWKDVDGDGTPDTFADYTNHSFGAFYMERGAGASNLDIQFNLKVVLTNQFTVQKEIPEDVDDRFDNQVYKFQATYMDGTTEKPLHANIANVCSAVVYKGTNNPVPVDDNGYFYLRAGEAAVFMMSDESIKYNVKEVDLDQYNLEKITINGDEVVEHVEINDQQATIRDNAAVAGYEEVGDRSNVLYANYPKTQNLLITKHISEDSAPLEDGEKPVFEFRVYLETTVTNDDGTTRQRLVPYSYGPYYLIKEVERETHYFTLTGVNNAPVDKGTTPTVCSTTGRSGSINSIPPEYTIVIPKLVVGTNFYLEERRDNIPEGYEFVREVLTEGTYDASSLIEDIDRVLARDEEDHQEFDPHTVGQIKDGVDAESHVYNRKPAVIITVEKAWDPDPDADTTVTVELHRYAKITKGTISVTLYDNNEAPIEGAEFELYKDGEATGTKVTTNVNGIASVSGLEAGTYKLVQLSTPAGYSMDGHTTETKTLTVVDNVTTPQTLSESLINTALVTAGRVTLTITDSGVGSGTAGAPISGATFALYKNGAIYNTGYTSNDEGKVVVGNLDAGEYYFVQTATTADYNLPNVIRTENFTVLEQPGVSQTFTQSITNSLKGKGTVSLTLKKNSGEDISGAFFQLKSGSTVLETGTTDTDGTLSFSTELYEGTYTVHQADTGSAGDDYATAADQNVTIEANSVTIQQKSLTFVNEEARGTNTVAIYRGQGDFTGYANCNNGDQIPYKSKQSLKAGETVRIRITREQTAHIMGYCTDYTVKDQTGSGTWVRITSSSWDENSFILEYTIPAGASDQTFNIGVISAWDKNAGNVEFLDSTNPNMLNTRLKSSAGRLHLASTQVPEVLNATRSATHTNASPAAAPAGYAEDSSFDVIERVLTAPDWSYTFPLQDKYDADGNPYYYYVIEKDCSDKDYWIDSYTGDSLNESGTITVTNKKEKTGNLTITKELLGDVTGNEDKAYKVTITNSEGLYLQADGSFSATEHLFTVSSANPLQISDIPIDTYTVTEKTDAGEVAIEGYLWNGEESTTGGTGAVTYRQTTTVELKNYYDEIYTPTPSDMDVKENMTVNKTWVNEDNREPSDEDEILFKIRVKSADAYVPVKWDLYDAGTGDPGNTNNLSGIYYVEPGSDVGFTVTRPSNASETFKRIRLNSNVSLWGESGAALQLTNRVPSNDNNQKGYKPNAESFTYTARDVEARYPVEYRLQPWHEGSTWVEGSPTAAGQWNMSVAVEAGKQYYDDVKEMRDALIDDNASVETLVYRLKKNTAPELVESLTSASIRPGQVTGSGWNVNLIDLPTYERITTVHDGVTTYGYKVYSYEIEEIEVNGKKVTDNRTDDYLVSTSTSTSTAGDTTTTTITNTEIRKVNADAVKAWKGADNEAMLPPDGATVTFELFADGEETGKRVVLNGKTMEQEIREDDSLTAEEQAAAIAALAEAESGEFTAWKAEWRNLPKYSDDAQTLEISYTVKEVSGCDGFTNQNLDGVNALAENPADHVITNKQDTVNFDLLKVAKGTTTPLPKASFVIQEVKESSTTASPQYADGSEPSAPQTTGADGTIHFTEIAPGYYEIQEKKAPDGYVLTGDASFYVKVDSTGVKLLKKVINGNTLTFAEAAENEKVGNVTASTAGATVTFTVENTPGTSLPNTGGAGTGLFIALGGILTVMAGAVLTLTTYRRKKTA